MKIRPKTTNATNGRAGKRSAGLGAALAPVVVDYYALRWRKNPSACPSALRFFVGLPHPFITRARLRETLAPRPGERVLEPGREQATRDRRMIPGVLYCESARYGCELPASCPG